MTEQDITLSVIVPVYNHEDYLSACLQSVLSQTDAGPIELIVVDDASPNPKVTSILTDISTKLRHGHIVRNDENLGIVQTQLKAVELATGQYIAFLDCDDCLPKGALARVKNILFEHPDTDYLFTDRIDVDQKGKKIGVRKFGGYPHIPPTTPIEDALMDGMVASHLKVIRRQAVLDHVDPKSIFSGIQDWELALDLAHNGATFRYVPESLYHHRIHAGSVTASSRQKQFQISSVLRRGALLHRYRPRTVDLKETHWLTETFGPHDLQSLKSHWGQGYKIGFRCDTLLDWDSLHFLMIYNSYFDRIDLADMRDELRLMGYLWNPRILIDFQVCYDQLIL